MRKSWMELHLRRGCHCCERSLIKMDIDAALDELGMLSTVTESRKQYLKERARTRSESSVSQPGLSGQASVSVMSSPNTSAYKIVHIDTKFVTGFSDTLSLHNTLPQPSTEKSVTDDVFKDLGKDYRKPPDVFDSEIDQKRKIRMRTQNIAARNRRLLARARNRKPYEVPWRLTQSFQESDLVSSMERSCLLDNKQSKSNTSSPVKSFSEDCLTRSRSLDHLDFSSLLTVKTLESPEDKHDVDSVASGMNELHVNDDS